MLVKWVCKQCYKNFYTREITPEVPPKCHCTWEPEVRIIEVECKPTKKRLEDCPEIWGWTAHLLSDSPEEAQEKIDKMPF